MQRPGSSFEQGVLMCSNPFWIARVFGMAALCLLLVGGPRAVAEQPYPVEWIQQIGTSIYDESHDLAIDNNGNLLMTGWTRGSLGGPIARRNSYDVFLAKFDPSGNEVWIRQFGSVSSDNGRSIALDHAGNSYVSGSTYGSLGGPATGNQDAFLAKLDPFGNELWTRQVGREEAWQISYAVDVDLHGNAFMAGTITREDLPKEQSDVFLTKFDTNGNELWTRHFASEQNDEARSVAVDASGNVYIGGYTHGVLSGDDSDGSGIDPFLIKLDSSGDELWRRQLIGSTLSAGYSVVTDIAGNVYMGGRAYGFGLDGRDSGTFLIKFDSSGSEQWLQHVVTQHETVGYDIAVDLDGNAFMTVGSSRDVLLTKYDSQGIVSWTRDFGSSGNDDSYAVVVDNFGNPYISGFTDGDLEGPNAGFTDAFLVKFTIPEPASLGVFVLGGMVLLRLGGR